MSIRPEVLLIAGGAVLLALVVANKGAAGAGQSAGAAAVDLVDGVFSGAVVAVGEKIGIPKTNIEQGRADMAAGNWWDASFNLPAGEFLRGVWGQF